MDKFRNFLYGHETVIVVTLIILALLVLASSRGRK